MKGTVSPMPSPSRTSKPMVRPGKGRKPAAGRTASMRSAGPPPPVEFVDPALGRKYFVVAISGGCPSNFLEAAAWREHFRERGYGPADSPEAADVIVVNTCAVRLDKEDQSAETIRDFRQRFGQDKLILVSGCMEGINPERLHDVHPDGSVTPPGGDLAFQAGQHRFDPADFGGLDPKHKVVLFLRGWYFQVERLLGRRFQPLHNLLRSVMVSERFYLLTVAVGCLGGCSYCAIRNAKGTVQSRELAGILEEFDRALADGYKDIWLIADDLGCWGQDLGTDLPALLSGLLARPGDFRLVINYLGPQFLLRYPDELAAIFRDPRIILVNVPIQSGSDPVLKRMGRGEAIDRVLSWIAAVKRDNPAMVVKTNIMVGFPGETWADLVRTWRAMLRFDAIVAVAYSPRPGTPAESFPDRPTALDSRLRLAATQVVGLGTHLGTLARSVLG